MLENTRKIGAYYEEQACQFLCHRGLVLIAKNSLFRLGEIDLIMRDNSCLVFVEVRYRKNSLYGNAQSTITKVKQHKIIQAAHIWMQNQQIDIESCEYRFDVFAITGKNCQWIKNAFSL